jgi:HemY protein
MKWLITLLIVLATAIAFALYLPDDSGFIVFGRGAWSIETSLTAFIIALGFSWFAFYFFIRFFIGLSRLPDFLSRYQSKKRSRKDHQSFWQGVSELLQERWSSAEQILIKDIAFSEQPILRYLGAAYAALQQKSPARAMDYFEQAQSSLPKDKLSLLFLHIKWASLYQKPEFTLKIAQQAYTIAPKDKKVLTMLKDLYIETQGWTEVLSLLPELRKQRVLTSDESKILENQATVALAKQTLRNADKNSDEAWTNMAKNLKDEPAVLALYVSHLIADSRAAVAEPLLRNALKNQWNIELLALYGKLNIPTGNQQMEFLENMLRTRSDDADLLLALGQICMSAQLWEKAAYYLESSVKISPHPTSYQLLGEVLTHRQNLIEANKCYQLGLQLALKK